LVEHVGLKLQKREETPQSFCDMSLYYFAFGSNMGMQRMDKRKVKFTDRQKGIMKDWKLVFNKIRDEEKGSGYANIEPEIGSIVEGIIYKVSEEGIEKLDRREGVPDDYLQETMSVGNNNQESINCIVYIANRSKINNSLKPERWYLNHLLAGKEFLSENYYSWLEQTSTID